MRYHQGHGERVRPPDSPTSMNCSITREHAPEHTLVTIEDVGNVAAFLVSDAARMLTGNVEYVDAGYHVMS